MRASVKSATRFKPSSRALSPASARTPAPNVKVGMATVKPRSLVSTAAKSAWQQGMMSPRWVIRRSGRVAENHIRRLFRDHDDGCVRVAGHECGHDAAIDDTQAGDTVHAQLRID